MYYEGINLGLLESTQYCHLIGGDEKIVGGKKKFSLADVPIDIRTGHDHNKIFTVRVL
jgi:hypothetical protein